MVNALYPSGAEEMLNGGVDFNTDDLRLILIDLADYTYSSAHDFLDDVAGASRVATSTALTSPTITGGVFDAADVVFSSVSGDPSEALILYRHTGTESTSHLILYLDTGVTGLPVTPSGGDITVQWNAGGIITIV